jgi:signal transduction histidine kinase
VAEYGGQVAVRARIERWGDWALTLALLVGIESEVAFDAPAGLEVRGGRGALALVAALLVLPLAWRCRAPLVVLAAMLTAFVVAMLLITQNRGVPLSLVIAFGVAFYSVGAHASGRRSVGAVVLGLATVAVIDILSGGVFQSVGGARPGVWVLLAVAWQVGREAQRRRIEMGRLRARAAELELDREERLRVAAAEERARIARELHDVVAHSVSVMVVQAQAAERVLVGDEASTRELLGSIETTGRQALTELRRLLGLLRSLDGEASLAPQPSLRYLDALIDHVRDAGLPVELVVEGSPTALPQGVDLSAYRIVQEGLTNALKHAGPARARVLLRYSPAELELEVSDDGEGRANGGSDGSGQGLVGMRERVALYGGELSTGRGEEGGYLLRARLPLGSNA